MKIKDLKKQLRIGVISYDETPPRGYGACERIAYEFARYCDQNGWDTTLLAMRFREDIDYGNIKLITTKDLYKEDDITLLNDLDLVLVFHPGAAFHLVRIAIEKKSTNAFFGIDVSWPELIPKKMGQILPKEKTLCYTLCNRVATIYLEEKRPFCTVPLIIYPDELPSYEEFKNTHRENSVLWMANADPGRYKDLDSAILFAEKAGCHLIVADGGTFNRNRKFPDYVTRLEEVYGTEKKALFTKCKAFLYTHPKGANEAGSTAILEALYSGLPVYAFNTVSGSPADTFVINGYNGFSYNNLDRLIEAYKVIDCIDRETVWNYGRTLFNPNINSEKRLYELLRFAKYI